MPVTHERTRTWMIERADRILKRRPNFIERRRFQSLKRGAAAALALLSAWSY
jgi:hypothetical protein